MYIKNMKINRQSTNIELTDDEVRAILACIHMSAREGMYEFTELDGINDDSTLISIMKKLGVGDSDIDYLLKGI